MLKKYIDRVITLIFLLGVAAFSLIPQGQAAAINTNNFYFSNAEFDYYLESTENGNKMHVKEVLTAVFPDTNQNHGISRVIPTTNQGGKNTVAESEGALNLTVTRNGARETISKVERAGNYFTFYIGNASEYVHGEQTYTLEYDFYNVVTEFDGSGTLTYAGKDAALQELYWDTNGTDWGQSFNNLTARVHLPASVAGKMTSGTSCYVGRYGTTNENKQNVSSRCLVSMNDETTYNSSAYNASSSKSAETVIEFATSNLSAGENLSFVLDFEPGTFTVPQPAKNYILVIILAGEAVGCVILLVLAILKYRKVTGEKARYYKSLFVKPEYQPINGMTVAESAEIATFSTKPSLVATLLELAVERKVEIIKDAKQGVLKEKVTWKVKVKNSDDLTGWQEAVLAILNGGSTPKTGEEIEVKSHRATASLEATKKSYSLLAQASLTEKGLMEEKPQTVSAFYALIPFLALFFVPSIGFGILMSSPNVAGGVAMLIAVIAVPLVAAIIATILSTKSTKYGNRTEKGLEASKYQEGLKLYITMAEGERLKFLQSVKGADTSAEGIVKLYEKLLPYACIFGVEESWLNELNKYYKENPQIEHGWYYGDDLMTFAMFHSMMNTTSSTIVSSTAYSSSSSSGGGGGGFSGGGGGGGGGGGW